MALLVTRKVNENIFLVLYTIRLFSLKIYYLNPLRKISKNFFFLAFCFYIVGNDPQNKYTFNTLWSEVYAKDEINGISQNAVYNLVAYDNRVKFMFYLLYIKINKNVL